MDFYILPMLDMITLVDFYLLLQLIFFSFFWEGTQMKIVKKTYIGIMKIIYEFLSPWRCTTHTGTKFQQSVPPHSDSSTV